MTTLPHEPESGDPARRSSGNGARHQPAADDAGDGTALLRDAAGRNRLLASLPPHASDVLLGDGELVSFALRDRLFEVGEPVTHVHFPISAVTSVVTVMDDGSAVETATVGSEGLVGISVLLGASTATSRAFAQIPGVALRVPARTLKAVRDANDDVQRVLDRYVLARLAQVAQTVACNRLHEVERRCARWLLMTQDRVQRDQFPMTQDFLAQMLGVRRATVSTVASDLQRRGLIRYRRGQMRVLDRAGLEAASCECYRTVKREHERLLGREEKGDGRGV